MLLHLVQGGMLLLGTRLGVVVEELTGRVVIVAFRHMVAFATTLIHMFASISVHISGKTLLPASVGAGVSVGTVLSVRLQNVFDLNIIIILFGVVVPKCFRVFHFAIETKQHLNI